VSQLLSGRIQTFSRLKSCSSQFKTRHLSSAASVLTNRDNLENRDHLVTRHMMVAIWECSKLHHAIRIKSMKMMMIIYTIMSRNEFITVLILYFTTSVVVTEFKRVSCFTS
jgi:hypothetical protein